MGFDPKSGAAIEAAFYISPRKCGQSSAFWAFFNFLFDCSSTALRLLFDCSSAPEATAHARPSTGPLGATHRS
jgi:hypothetical protein